MSEHYSLANSQVHRIAQLCDFLEHLGLVAAVKTAVPVSMPPSVGALGFDEPLWVGLGLVGLWAALDAYIERLFGRITGKCSTCEGSCLPYRVSKLVPTSAQIAMAPFYELEDLRNLYAHNFSGCADAEYVKRKGRHVLIKPLRLTCGDTFDGVQIALQPAALRHYAMCAKELLAALR